MCTHTHVHTYTCTHIHTYTCTHVHMYTCTHVHMYTCTYIHMYTCTDGLADDILAPIDNKYLWNEGLDIILF